MVYCCQVNPQYLGELNFLVSEHIFASSHLLLHQSDFLHLPGLYQFYHLKIFWRNLSGPFPRPHYSALCSLKGEKVGKCRDYYFQVSNFQKTFYVNFFEQLWLGSKDLFEEIWLKIIDTKENVLKIIDTKEYVFPELRFVVTVTTVGRVKFVQAV